jgi:hypothetical protein
VGYPSHSESESTREACGSERVIVREVPVVRQVQIQTTIVARGGELIFDNTNLEGERVPVFADKAVVRVGCHTLSRGAWELLKRKVDSR